MRSLAASSSTYFAANILVMAAGLVSMPIMTRLLSQTDYGVLNLVFAMVAVLASISQFGFPNATVRFYAERQAQGQSALRTFADTMLTGSLVASGTVAIVAAVAAAAFAAERPPEAVRCLQAGCVIVVVRTLASVVFQLYRAEERTRMYFIAQIVSRYGTLALVVALLVLRGPTVFHVVVGTAIGEGVMLIACLIELTARGAIARPRLSGDLLRAAATYGLPLTAAGSATFLMDYGDRFLIEHFLGASSVATYAVPYDLAQTLATAACTPVRLAVIPVMFRLWTHEGEAATSRMMSQVLSYMIAVLIPIGVLYLLMNREVVVLLASAKYADSASLTPYLLPGVLIGELNFIINAGLTIQKNTLAVAGITFASAALNMVLAALLLPLWGLKGAAVATTIAFVVLVAVTYRSSRTVLPLGLETGVIAKAVLATAVMAAVLLSLGPVHSQLFDLASRSAVGVGAAAACMVALDRQLRRRVLSRLRVSA